MTHSAILWDVQFYVMMGDIFEDGYHTLEMVATFRLVP